MSKSFEIFELNILDKDIIEKILKFYNSGFPKSQWSMERLSSFFDEKFHHVCFVVGGDSIKGLIIGKNKDDNSCLMTLHALLVDDDLRGMGYARKLTEAFIKKSFDMDNIKKIGLHFRESNELKDFYAKFGFNSPIVDGTYKNGEIKYYMEISKDDIIRTNH
jgi:ribosomal protein S18 acetylase RimI-like enzyme